MIYVDTSVAVALFVPEAKTAAVTQWLASTDAALVSADWILTELASALSIKERRGELSAADAEAVWSEFRSFCEAGLSLVAPSRKAFATAARLARDASSNLRAGDALHLAVALDAGVSHIATTDTILDANARKHGLASVGF